MKEKYISNKKGICPKCGEKIYYIMDDFMLSDFLNDPFPCAAYECKKCGCTGTEHYELSFNGHSVVINYEEDEEDDVNEYLLIDNK